MAVQSAGPWSNEVNATPNSPDATDGTIENLVAVAGDSMVTLTWDYGSVLGSTAWEVQRKLAGADDAAYVVVGFGGIFNHGRYVDTADEAEAASKPAGYQVCVNGHTYTYRVHCVTPT